MLPRSQRKKAGFLRKPAFLQVTLNDVVRQRERALVFEGPAVASEPVAPIRTDKR